MRESKKQLKNQLRVWVAKQRKRSRTQIQENLEPQFCYNCDMNDKKKIVDLCENDRHTNHNLPHQNYSYYLSSSNG